MKYTKKPFKPRTAGATPVDKWINLVKRWNSCKDTYDNSFSQQRMLFCKGEVNDLFEQYPSVYDDIKFYNSLTDDQMDFVVYADYKFNFEFPQNMPRPATIAGYDLIL